MGFSSKVLGFVLCVRSEVMSRKHRAGTAVWTSSELGAFTAVSFLGCSSEILACSQGLEGLGPDSGANNFGLENGLENGFRLRLRLKPFLKPFSKPNFFAPESGPRAPILVQKFWL